jgi:short-subunit dehydrogenase
MKRTALITGASAGLGIEFADQLAARGFDLLLVARRAARLEEVGQRLSNEHGVEVETFSADLSKPDAPAQIAHFVREHAIEVAYLVNNAGSAGPHLLEEEDWQPQAEFLELMMLSVTQMCHHFVPAMCERGYGRVINVSSFAGRLARGGSGCHYGPSKAYVIALSEELALDTRKLGVHVSALCPGFTHTDFHEAAGMMEMKQSLPDFLWYDAATVVREGIEAVEKGRAIMPSGRLYRWLDPIAQSVWLRPLLKALSPSR